MPARAGLSSLRVPPKGMAGLTLTAGWLSNPVRTVGSTGTFDAYRTSMLGRMLLQGSRSLLLILTRTRMVGLPLICICRGCLVGGMTRRGSLIRCQGCWGRKHLGGLWIRVGRGSMSTRCGARIGSRGAALRLICSCYTQRKAGVLKTGLIGWLAGCKAR